MVFLKPDEAAKRDRDFLSAELAERLKRGPVVFRLSVRLAGDGDPTHNTAVLWPADRPMIEAGRLGVTGNGPTNTADEPVAPARCHRLRTAGRGRARGGLPAERGRRCVDDRLRREG